uniref:Protein kinase domain-containing protein n=1 Tax=Euplotes crassus TaxID=5936 RepID=A0A7S3KQ12_EUPCR|mmetsp:Transcript_38616/g.38157  ORF Transcript_38616/g.38157 Transcript_38616/m.38157 type:complete len:144 (+) Transcript_38616:576-1007(+)
MAPEVASLKPKQKFNGKAADIYSLGVTIYLLLTGEFPNLQEIENTSITTGSDSSDIEMKDESQKPLEKFSKLSEPMKYLLQKMLHSDPSERPTITEILSYPDLCRPVDSLLISDAFSEMTYRKKYILSYCKTSGEGSSRHIIP